MGRAGNFARMATKSNTSVVSKPKDGAQIQTLTVAASKEERPRKLADVSLLPELGAGTTLLHFQPLTNDELDINQLIAALQEQAAQAEGNKFARGERMLAMQAHTLDALFNKLAQRAATNMGTYTQTAELYLRLALKAQSQCRTTIEALAEIKNPRPVAFVRQANIANGPQQVNNGSATSTRARASGNGSQPNKLWEAKDGERVDTRKARKAGDANTELETVGAGNRAAKRSRKG